MNDFLRSFRFAPRLGFDGKPMSVSAVRLKLGKPWNGPGQLKIKAPLSQHIIDMMKHDEVTPIVVDLFKGDLGKPSAMLVAHGVRPSQGAAKMSPLCATASALLTITAIMDYERLDIVFDPTVLDVLPSALI